MGGDHLQELIQTNISRRFESQTGSRFSSFTTSDSVFIESPSCWCDDFLAFDDQLVYLEQPAYDDPTSTSSSPSSQVAIDDERSHGYPINPKKLQKTNQMKEGSYASSSLGTHRHSDKQFKANELVRFPASKSKMSTLSARNDQQYMCSSSILESGANNRQSCLQKSVQRQTILKSPKIQVAKRKIQAMKKSEHDNKKKPRNETNSSVTLSNENKSGKERMGGKIATLQRLVSPFGKADTASVLSECIEYIRFLHEQVSVLSSLHGSTNGVETRHFQILEDCFYDKCEMLSGTESGLRSRGLCIVPVSSALCLTNDNDIQ